MALYEKLNDLENKRDAILGEINAQGTPEQQRERLLDKVKQDNQEIHTMDKQYSLKATIMLDKLARLSL